MRWNKCLNYSYTLSILSGHWWITFLVTLWTDAFSVAYTRCMANTWHLQAKAQLQCNLSVIIMINRLPLYNLSFQYTWQMHDKTTYWYLLKENTQISMYMLQVCSIFVVYVKDLRVIWYSIQVINHRVKPLFIDWSHFYSHSETLIYRVKPVFTMWSPYSQSEVMFTEWIHYLQREVTIQRVKSLFTE